MVYELKNSLLQVRVEDIGAQVLSVTDSAGTEYMWQRDPDIWSRTAPVLFPVIGRLRDGSYTLRGQSFSMPRHGFARDLSFAVTDISDASLTLSAKADADTKRLFPYEFTLEICYELESARLRKTHRVINRSPETMYFELGGHDGFRVAMEEGETMADYFIQFEGEPALRPRIKGEDGLISDERGFLPLDSGRLQLDMSLFRNDAIILDRLLTRRVLLCNAGGSRRLSFDFPDFPILGIWTPYKAFDTNFVCLEAWSSLPDSESAGSELSSKEGVCTLAPGTEARFCYITAFPLPT